MGAGLWCQYGCSCLAAVCWMTNPVQDYVMTMSITWPITCENLQWMVVSLWNSTLKCDFSVKCGEFSHLVCQDMTRQRAFMHRWKWAQVWLGFFMFLQMADSLRCLKICPVIRDTSFSIPILLKSGTTNYQNGLHSEWWLFTWMPQTLPIYLPCRSPRVAGCNLPSLPTSWEGKLLTVHSWQLHLRNDDT